MVDIGTPYKKNATKILLLGAGELAKEIIIEAQRLGIETIAVDRYEHAPGMQVAHRSHVISMLDSAALRSVLMREKPDFIVPEIEAIDTQVLLELEQTGQRVIPCAAAVVNTMNRIAIRRLASEKLSLTTSPYAFAENQAQFYAAVEKIGLPCVVKPVMSSSGKGQSIIRNREEIAAAWDYALTTGRGNKQTIIVEGYIQFDYEITLLTLRHKGGTHFCDPIGHIQIDGDYRESWQPHPMSEITLNKAQAIAKSITDHLGGYGLFGVEFFVKGEEIFFNEVSPRPHDTGMVTLISQNLSEFSLHLRALLGLPIPNIRQYGPAASCALLVTGKSQLVSYHHLEQALSEPDTDIRLFGKPEVDGRRRLGVALALADTIDAARVKASQIVKQIECKTS